MLSNGFAAASRAPKFPLPVPSQAVLPRPESLLSLRAAVARADCGTPPQDHVQPAAPPLLPLAIARLDMLLAGGLRRDTLHEIRSTLSRDNGAATGFAVAVLARLARADPRPILWIVEGASAEEAGAPYGRGLDGLGLDPRRLIVVRVQRPIDALWVAEEGL